MFPLLPLLILIPFLAIFFIVFLEDEKTYFVTIPASLAVLLLIFFVLFLAKVNGMASLSFSHIYISAINVDINFQLTNISLILVVMTAIVFFACSLVGKYFIGKNAKLYNFMFMLSEAASLGVFLSGNLFLLYLFWEVAEVLMFFIIFVYGGYDRRYAAIKFIIYSIISSLLLLIGIMMLYFYTTPHTFDIFTIEQNANTIPLAMQPLIMVLLLVAFMIKAPVFPFHSWLPDAHTEAPTTGSMILAGVLLKFGGYGILLMFLMVPIAVQYATPLAVIFGFSAIYGAFVALRQTHLKRMIAYTSIVDMGIIALGISAINQFGTAGAMYGMLSHGIAISILFLVAGTLDKVYGTLIINRLKGVMEFAPRLSYLFLFGVLVIIGLPLTTGFIADLLIFIGSYSAFGTGGLIAIAAIVIVGAYFFWVMEKVFFTARHPSELYDVVGREVMYSGWFLALFAVLLGILPGVLLNISGL